MDRFRVPQPATWAALALLLLAPAARAQYQPGMFMDLGTAANPGTYATQTFSDTAGIRIFIERDSLPQLEGLEFLLGYDCHADSLCRVTRSLRVVSFQPDLSLISGVEHFSCDNICTCDSCYLPTHYRLHIRSDRLSTLPANLKVSVGTLHVRTSSPMTAAELHFSLAYLWTFGDSPLELRPFDVGGRTNQVNFGGITSAGATRWGVLRRIYR